MAGLCGCEKQLIPEINLTDYLEGSWEKVYPEGVQDAGLVIWTFSTTNKESQDPFILTIYVSDVFAGDSEAKYIYQQHQNGYPGVGSSTPELGKQYESAFSQETIKGQYCFGTPEGSVGPDGYTLDYAYVQQPERAEECGCEIRRQRPFCTGIPS